MTILRVVIACLFLCGCSAQTAALYGLPIVAPAQKQQVASKVLVQHDPHTGSTQVIGPLIFHDNNLLGNTYQIRSWTNPGDSKIDNRFQIVATGRYDRRVYLKQAYAEGQQVSTTVIDRERVRCADFCIIKEVVGINLSEQEMAHRAETGMSFKVVGRRASLIMTIPPGYFAAVLDAHRKVRAAADA